MVTCIYCIAFYSIICDSGRLHLHIAHVIFYEWCNKKSWWINKNPHLSGDNKKIIHNAISIHSIVILMYSTYIITSSSSSSSFRGWGFDSSGNGWNGYQIYIKHNPAHYTQSRHPQFTFSLSPWHSILKSCSIDGCTSRTTHLMCVCVCYAHGICSWMDYIRLFMCHWKV